MSGRKYKVGRWHNPLQGPPGRLGKAKGVDAEKKARKKIVTRRRPDRQYGDRGEEVTRWGPSPPQPAPQSVPSDATSWEPIWSQWIGQPRKTADGRGKGQGPEASDVTRLETFPDG
jgi:hypothetical protein